MKTEELSMELDTYLKKACDSGKVFIGRKQRSKTFQIYGFCQNLIIIQYDSYPKHYALEKKVLLTGIELTINQKKAIRLTSEYASEIEASSIQRHGTSNKTSVLTKFYFSLHNGFLNDFRSNGQKAGWIG